jgi:hypothetical protein
VLSQEQQDKSDDLRDRKGWGDRRIASLLKVSYGHVRGDRQKRWPAGFEYSEDVRKLQALEDLDLIEPPKSGMKTLIYDIETAPTKAWVWSNWQTNVIATDQDWYMLSFCYKWEGDDSVGFVSIFDNPGFVPNEPNDLWVAERLASLFDAADVLVAHNGNKFDRKKANARFILNDIDQPSPYMLVDTMMIARREFAFNSNSLNNLASYFKMGKKTPHTGFQMWLDCMDGDPEAWELMERYNVQDVLLLEELYLKLRPWSGLPGKPLAPNKNHWKPNGNFGCPKCGSDNVIERGTHRTAASEFPTVKCLHCRGYSRLRDKRKGIRKVQ